MLFAPPPPQILQNKVMCVEIDIWERRWGGGGGGGGKEGVFWRMRPFQSVSFHDHKQETIVSCHKLRGETVIGVWLLR